MHLQLVIPMVLLIQAIFRRHLQITLKKILQETLEEKLAPLMTPH